MLMSISYSVFLRASKYLKAKQPPKAYLVLLPEMPKSHQLTEVP